MDVFAIIAERRIREAMERGEFNNLAGHGKPLVMEDLSAVPEELRMAYKVLKNAGCVPPEVELSNEVASLRRLVLEMEESEERMKKVRELNFKLMKLEMTRKRPLSLDLLPEYQGKLLDRLGDG
ncbi:DnaJ family domain-containing protein [Geomonas ferrireducens]|uniref:DnaJ family domain-containing protein n=1 Tax=Geomonas ferrireducens TaxID=2570227 RepID=UPI0010A8A885|nr:DnaJ family domain-containing protein [Geomonas ferrireducens]